MALLHFPTMEAQSSAKLPSSEPISVTKDDIPKYLKSGDFYKSLDEENPSEAIDVPGDTLKPDRTVKSEIDLIHLLTSLRYWMVVEPQIEILEYFLSDGIHVCSPSIDQFEQCFPYLGLFQSLLVAKAESEDVMEQAIKFGHVDIVIMLHELGYLFSEGSCESAVLSGNHACLKYVVEKGCSITELAFSAAASTGQLEALKYMHSIANDPKICPFVCQRAAANGHVECLQFLYEHGYRCSYETAATATTHNQLQVLQYLNRLPPKHFWFQSSPRIAATNGFVEILEFLNENGYPWSEHTMAICVQHGRLDAMKYLYQKGCPWDYNTCMCAMYGDHLECLKFAVENGCWYLEDIGENCEETISQEMRDYVAQLPMDYDAGLEYPT